MTIRATRLELPRRTSIAHKGHYVLLTGFEAG
jgi:hypothetical protein